VIRGVHAMFYCADADAFRAFLREKFDLPSTDVGDGWLIFDAPEVEVACHPADERPHATSGTHHISFYCDDIERTVAELTARGVEFTEPITDQGFGLVTALKVPGNFSVMLYQRRYAKASS